VKSQRLWWPGYVAWAEDVYATLVEKPLARPRRRWNNIKMHIREIDCDSGAGVGWN
jgi:hypothetical protein